MVELATILVGVVVPLIIGPLSVFCKSLWDRYSKSRELKRKNRYETKMEQLSQKINIFYWPVYLKLKTLDRINYQLRKNSPEPNNYTLDMGTLGETTMSEPNDYSSDGGERIRNRRKKRKIKCSKPNCPLINHNPNLSSICHKCRLLDTTTCPNFLPRQNITIKSKENTNSKDNELSRYEGESIMLGSYMIDSEIESEVDELQETQIKPNYQSEVELEWNPEPWEDRKTRFQSLKKIQLHDDLKIEETNLIVTVDKFFLSQLDNKILKLTVEIMDLMEKNVAIIQPSKGLVREMIKFTRYGEMLEIVQKTNMESKNKYNMEDLGVVNNTRRLITLVKTDLEKYMLEYDETFESYNNVEIQSCGGCK